MSSKSTTGGSSKKSFNETKAFFQNIVENQSKLVKTVSKSIPAPKRKSLTLTEKWAKFNKSDESDEKAGSLSKPRASLGSKPRKSTSSQKVVKNESPPAVSSIPDISSPLTSPSLTGSTPATVSNVSKLDYQTKKCMTRGCYILIPLGIFKRCPGCREIERLKVRVKKQEATLRLLREQNEAAGTLVKAEDEDVEMQDVEALALLGERGTKRKAPPKLLNELQGEELKKAVKIMKTGVRRLIAELAIPVPTETANSNLTEYQTASDLYEAVRLALASASPGALTFVGHHTIIAVSTISNAKRAQYVSKDLRKLVKLPFEYSAPIGSKPDLKNPTMHCIRFKCTCLAAKKTLGAAQPAAQPPVACSGRVKITVTDDTTHPHFTGQKIEVRVRHSA